MFHIFKPDIVCIRIYKVLSDGVVTINIKSLLTMKTIILPTDFSNNAWKAAVYAVTVFRDTPCRFILFHVFSEPEKILETDVAYAISTRTKRIYVELNKIKNGLEDFDHHIDTTFETSARYGTEVSTIVQATKNQFADLIVMGRTGSNSSEAAGSLTIQLLTELPCPVICIPENSELTSPEHIMLATDYQDFIYHNQLNIVTDIAHQNKSRISIVNIKKDILAPVPIDNALEGFALHNFLDEIPHEYFDHEEEEVEEGILNFAHQKNVDLIVMMSRKRKFWEDLFHISISRTVGIHSDLPLLVIKEKSQL